MKIISEQGNQPTLVSSRPYQYILKFAKHLLLSYNFSPSASIQPLEDTECPIVRKPKD